MLGVALGLASLAGINLYLTVFVTGLAIRMDWRKLNCPPEDGLETTPGRRLPGHCELQLRRSHASTAAIEWAVPCLSGGGARPAANLSGWLVCLHEEPSRLFFVS